MAGRWPPAYGVLREVLEASVAIRICRMELWNLSTANSGWLAAYTALAGIQPVGTDTLRTQAVARVRGLARYLDAEVENLRAGRSQGLTAPRVIAEGVLRQLDDVLATPPDSSPFAGPIHRDTSRAFREGYRNALQRDLIPALRRYRRHLAEEYLPRARAGGHTSMVRRPAPRRGRHQFGARRREPERHFLHHDLAPGAIPSRQSRGDRLS